MNGQWRFVSGCQQAAWFLLLCPLMDGDKPVLDEQANPTMLFVFLPAAQVTIMDTWYTLGLRGTGSHNIEITDQFVPDRRAAALAPLEQPGSAFTGPLYRLTIWPPIALLAPPALGIARASVDDFVALARGKTPSFTGTTLADRQVVQRQVAQADAHVKAGRAFLHQAFGDAWDAAVRGHPIELDRKLVMQLATSHAVSSAATAVDLVHAAAGTSAIRDEQPFQQHFRDVHTLTQHAFSSAQRFESVGGIMLGSRDRLGLLPLLNEEPSSACLIHTFVTVRARPETAWRRSARRCRSPRLLGLGVTSTRPAVNDAEFAGRTALLSQAGSWPEVRHSPTSLSHPPIRSRRCELTCPIE